MKKQTILLLAAALFASCNAWLDDTPNDQQLERDQFASEGGIQSANNGLYRELIGVNLYGGHLTQTTIEAMGHFYTYGPTEPGDVRAKQLYHLAHFQWDQMDEVKSRFNQIWNTAYPALYHINTYIKNVTEAPVALSATNRNILLGEAYGLRAYLHFDLFRLFGPAWKDKTGAKILPYNKKTTIVINHPGYEESEYSSADEYMTLLLQDIRTADSLLQNSDPVIDDPESITKDLLNDHFYQNRNRRMNYYAVKGLEARVRQYLNEHELAAQAAQIVTDQVGDGKRFQWVNRSEIEGGYNNFIFFSEAIFGIDNLNLVLNGTEWYMNSEFYNGYLVDAENLSSNILGYGDAIEATYDIRARQWKTSNVTYNISGYSPVTYVSKKYIEIPYVEIPAIRDLQVLMRISEMYYIQAEAALQAGNLPEAKRILDGILEQRGLSSAYYVTETEPAIREHIEKEYYREFFGEGQVFFFHKRLGSTRMFKGTGAGTDPVANPASAYVVPIPDSEKNS